jgi:anti-sigma factor RsiW
MQCRMPPPLSEEELSQVLDGTASSHVLDHLAQCASCTARLKEYEQFESALKTRLYRLNCPGVNQLGEYHLGLVDDEETQAIRAHLKRCPHCRAELDELRAFLREDTTPPTEHQFSPRPAKTQPAARRSWLQEIAAVLMPPAPQAVLRGSESSGCIIRAQAEDGTIVRLAASAEDDMVTLRGQILGDPAIWVGALIEVRQAGRLLVVTRISESGQFQFEIAPVDTIDLKITAEKGPAIRVEDISLADLT